jgi:small subunit ribosomal protein S17
LPAQSVLGGGFGRGAKPPSEVLKEIAVGDRKTREGVVVSDVMQKTRVVEIERVFRHPRYQRVILRSKKLKAHDETNASHVGDRVLIEETRPMSRDKRWRIRQVLTRSSTG